MQLKPFNSFSIAFMMSGAFSILFLCSFLEFRTQPVYPFNRRIQEVGCQSGLLPFQREAQAAAVLQQIICESECGEAKLEHVRVLVKGWTWITDNLDNLYSCPCGLSCLWTKSYVLVNKPDALLFETTTPPLQLKEGRDWKMCISCIIERERERERETDFLPSPIPSFWNLSWYSARKAEMEVIRSELLDREDIQKFWDEKMSAEKTRGLEVEKAYLLPLVIWNRRRLSKKIILLRFKGEVGYGLPQAITSQSNGRGQ